MDHGIEMDAGMEGDDGDNWVETNEELAEGDDEGSKLLAEIIGPSDRMVLRSSTLLPSGNKAGGYKKRKQTNKIRRYKQRKQTIKRRKNKKR